jgi:hypothetical protein
LLEGDESDEGDQSAHQILSERQSDRATIMTATHTWLVPSGWWLVAGGWWLVASGWWLVAGGWWLVASG